MVYVLSDIHGNLNNFNSIMEQINLQPDDTLYVLGDVIDRYPHGIELLEKIMGMSNAKMLLGNHEYMMLRALGFPYDGDEDIKNENKTELKNLWRYYNSGLVTYLGWKKISIGRQMDIISYLKSLPLNIDIEVNDRKFKLVHAAPLEMYETHGKSEYHTKTFYAVWDRYAVFDMPETDYTIVFGHTPTSYFQDNNPLRIFKTGNLIGLDCGSGWPKASEKNQEAGCLACIRLDDMKEFYSEIEQDEKKDGIEKMLTLGKWLEHCL